MHVVPASSCRCGVVAGVWTVVGVTCAHGLGGATSPAQEGREDGQANQRGCRVGALLRHDFDALHCKLCLTALEARSDAYVSSTRCVHQADFDMPENGWPKGGSQGCQRSASSA